MSQHIERQKIVTDILIEGAEEEPEMLSEEDRFSMQRQSKSNLLGFFNINEVPRHLDKIKNKNLL